MSALIIQYTPSSRGRLKSDVDLADNKLSILKFNMYVCVRACVCDWVCYWPRALGGDSLRADTGGGARGRSVISCLYILSSDNAMKAVAVVFARHERILYTVKVNRRNKSRRGVFGRTTYPPT